MYLLNKLKYSVLLPERLAKRHCVAPSAPIIWVSPESCQFTVPLELKLLKVQPLRQAISHSPVKIIQQYLVYWS